MRLSGWTCGTGHLHRVAFRSARLAAPDVTIHSRHEARRDGEAPQGDEGTSIAARTLVAADKPTVVTIG